jgi:ATP-dependent DNA ligase
MLEELVAMAKECRFIKTAHPVASCPPRPDAVVRFLKKGWIAQEKINGRRLQVHVSREGELRFYTRQGTPHTMVVPDPIRKILVDYYRPNAGDWNALEGEWVPSQQKLYLFDFIIENDKLLSGLCYLDRWKMLRRDFISPNVAVLKWHVKLPEVMKILQSSDEVIEGVVFKHNTTSFEDRTIVRCRKNG